jgi:hypothetical protein
MLTFPRHPELVSGSTFGPATAIDQQASPLPQAWMLNQVQHDAELSF